MNDPNDKPITASQLARRIRVPVSWLRNEAAAGRIPHIKAGRSILFNAEVVERLLLDRAAKEGMPCAIA